MPQLIMFLIILVLIAVVVARNVVIVPQAAEYVVERLGSYSTTWENGLHFKLPFIERVAKRVSLKEQVMDFPPQAVITQVITSPCRSTRLSSFRSPIPSSIPTASSVPFRRSRT